MGYHNGLRALILFAFISTGYNSKITFPGEDEISSTRDSPTKSSIVTATPTPASSSSQSSSSSSDLSDLFSSSIFPHENNLIDEEINSSSSPILFNDENNNNEAAEVKGFVRSLEITDSGEVYNPDRKLRDEVDDRWNGWKFEDDQNKRGGWRTPPNEKTIAVQLLDDTPYRHGRPSWPHDEYLVGYFDLKGAGSPIRSNGSNDGNDFGENNVDSGLSQEEMSKYYEWKRLQPRPSPSAFIGPGFYDVSAVNPSPSADYYRYQQPSYLAITDGTGKVQSTSKGGSSSGGSSVEVPGTPSESNTNTRHFAGGYFPYDLYKRKRLRLQIHPGLIAAPLAGLAAFGAASALTSKPLLVELGYVRNKPELIGGGGWGLAGSPGAGGYRPYPPFYPPPNPPPYYPPIGIGHGSVGYPPPPHGHIGGGLGGFGSGLAQAGGVSSHSPGPGGGVPIYPILKPVRHKPETERGSWWNPFSALTPRLVIE